MAPTTHLHYALCWVISRWIRATSTTVTATSPFPCHPETAGPSPRVQCPRSAPAPLHCLWGGAPCQLWQTDPRCCQDRGSTERGNALRPRTHFIPSHLYWISQISGLRELVYPIKLHCKGRLCPASLPGAMGCCVGQAGGPGWGGQKEALAPPISQQPPPNSHHANGLLAPLEIPQGDPCNPVLPAHQMQTSGPAGTHTGQTQSPTAPRMEGQGMNIPRHRPWQWDTGCACWERDLLSCPLATAECWESWR